MEHRDEEFARVAEAQRTTKAEARREGIGTPDSGVELPARSYPDESGVADLGVDEPVLPARSDGGAGASRSGADPTGMFAGETNADRREEDRLRRILEEGFPETSGHWKEGGRLPNAEPTTCALCGGPIRDDDVVCPHCGEPLVAG